jgi:hypothetical protein
MIMLAKDYLGGKVTFLGRLLTFFIESTLIILAHAGSIFKSKNTIIIGNVALYGAISGLAAERFAVGTYSNFNNQRFR